MKLHDFNRILDLSGLTEDINKIQDIITDKIHLPRDIAYEIIQITDKKHIALWMAKQFANIVFKELIYTDENYDKLRNVYLDRVGVKPLKEKIKYPIVIYDTREQFIYNESDAQAFYSTYLFNLFAGDPEIGHEHNYHSAFVGIRDWINWYAQPGRTNINLNDYTFIEANQAAEEWHYNLKAGILEKTKEDIEEERKKAIITFPDGSYWLDLKTNYSEEECNAMGHCGRTNAMTLISYKDSKGQSHLTMAYDYNYESGSGETRVNSGTYRQLKGKNNSKPKEEYYDKILALFKKLKVRSYNPEYKPENDFTVEELPNEQLIDYMKTVKPAPSMLYIGTIIDKYINGLISFAEFKTILRNHAYHTITQDFLKTKLYDKGLITKEKLKELFLDVFEKLSVNTFAFIINNLNPTKEEIAKLEKKT